MPYIYVPASLLTAYQTATNWTYFSKYFSAIENRGESGGEGSEDNGNENLITFTIKNTEYQAKEGMTWEEWINSEYNTESFMSVDPNVGNLGGMFLVVDSAGEYVRLTDVILMNEKYDLM
jgi:hypothetical protein